MTEPLQMYMKNKTAHLQVSNWQREKMPSDATHPTSAQSILKPEYIVYTMYAIYKKVCSNGCGWAHPYTERYMKFAEMG